MSQLELLLKSGNKYPLLNNISIDELMILYQQSNNRIKWLFGYYDRVYWKQRSNIYWDQEDVVSYPLIVQYIFNLFKSNKSETEINLNDYIITNGLFIGIDLLIGIDNTVNRAIDQRNDKILIHYVMKYPHMTNNSVYYFKYVHHNDYIQSIMDSDRSFRYYTNKEYINGTIGKKNNNLSDFDIIADNLSGLLDSFNYDIIIDYLPLFIDENYIDNYIYYSIINVYVFHKDFVIKLCEKHFKIFILAIGESIIQNDYKFVDRLLQIYPINNTIINIIFDIYNNDYEILKSSNQMIETIKKYIPSFICPNIYKFIASLIYGDYKTISHMSSVISRDVLLDFKNNTNNFDNIPELGKYYLKKYYKL